MYSAVNRIFHIGQSGLSNIWITCDWISKVLLYVACSLGKNMIFSLHLILLSDQFNSKFHFMFG
jgi:hypothetical protein